MDKQKLNWVTWAVLAIAVLLVALMLGGSLNRTAHITLPPSNLPRDPAGGTVELYTIVRGPWTRVDRGLPDGNTRISLTNGEETYIWYGYDRDAEVAVLPAGEFSADVEQSIPTYEDILDLPVEDISLADYRPLDTLTCIYVETAADEAGYSTRYWVSVENGLLVQAERLLGENAVYRMTSLYVDQTEYDASRFTLPDGTVLLDDGGTESMVPIN